MEIRKWALDTFTETSSGRKADHVCLPVHVEVQAHIRTSSKRCIRGTMQFKELHCNNYVISTNECDSFVLIGEDVFQVTNVLVNNEIEPSFVHVY